MGIIIQEIAGVISDKFTEELQRLFTEARDIFESPHLLTMEDSYDILSFALGKRKPSLEGCPSG